MSVIWICGLYNISMSFVHEVHFFYFLILDDSIDYHLEHIVFNKEPEILMKHFIILVKAVKEAFVSCAYYLSG